MTRTLTTRKALERRGRAKSPHKRPPESWPAFWMDPVLGGIPLYKSEWKEMFLRNMKESTKSVVAVIGKKEVLRRLEVSQQRNLDGDRREYLANIEVDPA